MDNNRDNSDSELIYCINNTPPLLAYLFFYYCNRKGKSIEKLQLNQHFIYYFIILHDGKDTNSKIFYTLNHYRVDLY